MEIVTERIKVATKGDADVVDITANVAACLASHKLKAGTATVFVSGSTASITTTEYEPGLRKDIPASLERLAPTNGEYHHNAKWHDGNGHAHVRAALLGPSLTVPFDEGSLLLGTWQQIVLIDFDNRPRQREVIIQLIGSNRSEHDS